MPEGKRSPMTEDATVIAVAMVVDYLILVEELAPIPLMQEEITQAEYKRRFHAMTREQGMAEMQRIGAAEVIRLMGENNG